MCACTGLKSNFGEPNIKLSCRPDHRIAPTVYAEHTSTLYDGLAVNSNAR